MCHEADGGTDDMTLKVGLDDRFHESDSMLGVFAADSHFVAS
jgi:hypothetical protein